jgi:PPK2 family polyphosphate:nucleotide phosphotransferase
MKLKLNLADFIFDGNQKFSINKIATKIPDLYEDTEHYDSLMQEFREEMDELQSMMYAHNRYGLLIIFQAMDAAGKDGTIKHILSGVNPIGVKIHSFKRPTETELEHDFLWRSQQLMPSRGSMTIFNRSYYEEVLVVKVHPEILTDSQRLPTEFTENVKQVFEKRYEDIANMEKYYFNNGIRILKFFLNVSKKEQGERLIARIEDPAKNWKFEEQDIKEREHWQEYLQAYEGCIRATASQSSPWHIIPADDKKNMRLIVSQLIISELKKLNISYPASDPARHQSLQKLIATIKEQDKEV